MSIKHFPLSPQCSEYLHFVGVSNDAQRFIHIGWLGSILNKNHFNSSSLLGIVGRDVILTTDTWQINIIFLRHVLLFTGCTG